MTKSFAGQPQSVKPNQLKVGDTILINGEPAQITRITFWRDLIQGGFYGLDLIALGKPLRASFAEGERVNLLN